MIELNMCALTGRFGDNGAASWERVEQRRGAARPTLLQTRIDHAFASCQLFEHDRIRSFQVAAAHFGSDHFPLHLVLQVHARAGAGSRPHQPTLLRWDHNQRAAYAQALHQQDPAMSDAILHAVQFLNTIIRRLLH